MKRYRLLFIIAVLVSVQAFAMETEQDQEALLAQVLARNEGDLNKALFDAAENGHTQTVIALIECGADVHVKDSYGNTPLHDAAREGHTQIVVALIDAGADVYAKNRCGNTPLHRAAINDYMQTVIALVEHGADINAQDCDGNTPLHDAAEDGYTETVIALVKYDADVHAKNRCGDTPLHWAVFNGHTQTVIALIECGADVHAQDRDGDTPLHEAAEDGHTETVIALIGCGADVHAKDNSGNAPLHYAVLNGHTETVIALIDCGAKVCAENGFGDTPLHDAAYNGHAEIVQILLLADQGKTDQQVQDSRNRITTLLLHLNENNTLTLQDLQRMIMLQFADDIFSAKMLADFLPIADQEQILELIQHCPRELFVQVSKNISNEIRDTVIQEIVEDVIGQADELCKIGSDHSQTAYDFAGRSDELHPDDPEGKRAAFIGSRIGREFKDS